MKEGKSHIKDTADFLDKLKDLDEITDGAIIGTADVVGLYPSIPHTEGLKVLRKQYDKFLHRKVPTEDFVFNSKFFQQISVTVIGTTFAQISTPTLTQPPPPPMCLHFYGLYRYRISSGTIYKTVSVETIQRRCIFYLYRQ